jgi:hypothetical protein
MVGLGRRVISRQAGRNDPHVLQAHEAAGQICVADSLRLQPDELGTLLHRGRIARGAYGEVFDCKERCNQAFLLTGLEWRQSFAPALVGKGFVEMPVERIRLTLHS